MSPWLPKLDKSSNWAGTGEFPGSLVKKPAVERNKKLSELVAAPTVGEAFQSLHLVKIIAYLHKKASNAQQNRIQNNCNTLSILSSFQPKIPRQESVTDRAGVRETVHRNSL